MKEIRFRINLNPGGSLSPAPYTISGFIRAATLSVGRQWNRRNYYRVLNVQPEAPREIIEASYRTLRRELGKHPDSPGKGSYTELLQRAYPVLTDPDERARYDKELRALKHRLDSIREQGTVLRDRPEPEPVRSPNWERYRKRKSWPKRLVQRAQRHAKAYALLLALLILASFFLVTAFEALAAVIQSFFLY